MSDIHEKRAQILLGQHGKQRVGIWSKFAIVAAVVFCACGIWSLVGPRLPLWAIAVWVVSGLWVLLWVWYFIGPSLGRAAARR